MTTMVDPSRWHPLGAGRIAPAGSVRDAALTARLAAYKRDVAGAYRSVPPADLISTLPPGPYVVSEKVDGETWFLHRTDDTSTLLSPAGKAITGVPLTSETDALLAGWTGLLAGELYAARDRGCPRVFDLHAALGGGERAQVERLCFAAFDLLQDRDTDAESARFPDRAARLQELLRGGQSVRAASFEAATVSDEIAAIFERVVTHGGAEGLVVHAGDGRIFKIKSEIVIDAAVVGYAENDTGVSELLLALLTPDDQFQLIGRVRTGWSRDESHALATRLGGVGCDSAYRKVTDHGTLYRWVRPGLVVEVRCNDLLAVDSHDQAIRRMRLAFDDAAGWSPFGPAPSVSLINAVFLRVRDDKRPQRPDVRFEQVTDLVAVATSMPVASMEAVAPSIVRREVYTKPTRARLTVRKLVAWRTNRPSDPAWPAFVVHFTDYAPERAEPLKTDVRVASSEPAIHAMADDWLAANIRRGWEAVSVERAPSADAACAPDAGPDYGGQSLNEVPTRYGPRLAIAFARSSSPTFPIVRRRLDALASLGSLEITRDERDREAWFELRVERDLVENARRLANLLTIVRPWKSAEVNLDGEALGRREVDTLVDRLDTARRCWLRHKSQGTHGCRRSCSLGCEALGIWPAHERLRYAGNAEPCWWGVGTFDGERVAVDKAGLHEQVAASRNIFVRACPLFDGMAIAAIIDGLPDTLEAGETGWTTAYGSRDGKPAWIWPRDAHLPIGLSETPNGLWRPGDAGIHVDLGQRDDGPVNPVPTTPARSIPATRYSDVIGQDAAVEAVRDLIELPLRHADLFARIGARPQAHGVLLAGPPGTGKTLLARAVAGECGAHVEIVSGPALLSKWVGESEAALRAIFERARELAPSVILFDEIDSLAPRRDGGATHDVSVVAQLLVLLDGLDERGQVFVLGTTNRPDDIDPALRRPGRFDQVVWMGLPDEAGRAALFEHHLRGLTLEAAIDRSALAVEMAATTDGCTGADVAFICQRAALLCVKAASRTPSASDVAITVNQLQAALAAVTDTPMPVAVSVDRQLQAAG
jgi:AAA+ superfamily predicted ATPase/ATP-dependent DNA ligase